MLTAKSHKIGVRTRLCSVIISNNLVNWSGRWWQPYYLQTVLCLFFMSTELCVTFAKIHPQNSNIIKMWLSKWDIFFLSQCNIIASVTVIVCTTNTANKLVLKL